MKMEKLEQSVELESTVARLSAAAGLLEQAMERLSERQHAAETTIGRISATVESELEERLTAAEVKIAELEAAAAEKNLKQVTNHRKTVPAEVAALLTKQGTTVGSLDAGALDTALGSLSLEQRIAVKAQLLRSGLLS